MKKRFGKISELFLQIGLNGKVRNLIALIALLFATFLIFRWLHVNDSTRLLSAASSIMRNESVTGNTYSLSKALSDIETLGLLDCARVRELNGSERLFYDSSSNSGCYMDSWISRLRTTSTEITSVNGTRFFVSIQSKLDLTKIFLELIIYLIIFVTFSQIEKRLQRDTKLAEARIMAVEIEKQMVVDHARQIKHDVASPLTAIDTIIRLIPQVDPEVKSVLALALERTNVLFNELSQPLKVSVEKSDKKKELEKVEILPLVQEIVAEKKSTWLNSVEIMFVNTIAERAFSCADKNSLKRIMSNLLNNAFEATEKIKEPKILVETTCSPTHLSIEISDNGIGIPLKDLPRIGQKGVSIGKGNHPTAGAGLGVYGAIQMLKSWDGNLKIRSIEDSGTTVTVSLKRI